MKNILIMFAAGLLALVGFMYFLDHSMSNTADVDVENCEEAGADAVQSLIRLMDEDGMKREFYDMIARGKEHRCIFFTYSPKFSLLRSGKDMYGGYTGMYRISPAQLKNLKIEPMHDDSLFRLLEPFKVTDVKENPPSRTMDMFILF